MAVESKEKDNKIERLYQLCDTLPPCCESFLTKTGTARTISTRWEYAMELSRFFDYLIYVSPVFCDLNKRDFTTEHIKQITAEDITGYISFHYDKKKMKRTLARKRAVLSSFFKYLMINQIIEYNPAAASTPVKVPESDEVIHLNVSEQLQLLDAVDSGDYLPEKKKIYHDRYKMRDYAIILLFLDTGMRISELHGINIGHVNIQKRSVRVRRKGGNEQTLYYSDEAAEALSYVLEARWKYMVGVNDPLFVTLQGKRLSIRAIQVLVKKYTDSALPEKAGTITPHKMRSSFAMTYYREEKDILALQRKLGHKKLATTNIYAKATNKEMEDTRSVIEKARDRKRENV